MKFSEIRNLINESHSTYNLNSENYRRDDFYNSRDIKIINNSERRYTKCNNRIYEKANKSNFEENDYQKKFRKILEKSYCSHA